ncbi:hypothetical protein DL239_20255 [Sedimentitalea sp. CY04]|uniref:XRE family transcriptional regulator n=1 Tax=Parasedimentitalea denitrificans TaxID=2211118 RepID=A0ABX0WET5_9RHOB|nr:hypothetical protein [Sedimentitalea sp. CY04]NIZ63304.1 hypothetical protein [Sedimentitalea sp. CY04]
MTIKITREDDLLELEVLHLRENKGLQGGDVMARLGVTRGFISGVQSRVRKATAANPCECKRKANRDCGMRQRWWAS